MPGIFFGDPWHYSYTYIIREEIFIYERYEKYCCKKITGTKLFKG